MTTAEPPVVTTEPPEITTPPEATTEPLPPFEPIPIPDTAESQGGRYVTDGNYIYFADPLNGYALTRMNMDLSDPIVLDSWKCRSLHLDDQFLYYNAIDPDISDPYVYPDLHKIELSTDTITDFMSEASLIAITEDRILLSKSGKRLLSIRKDGLDIIEMFLEIEEYDANYKLLGNFLYFTCSSDDESIAGLYRISITGGKPERFMEGNPGWVISADGKLYFSHFDSIDWSQYPYDYVPPITYTLYELSPDGTLRAITEKIGNFGRLEVSGGWAYYSDYGLDPQGLWKMKLDGSEKMMLFNEEIVNNIKVIDDSIFFSAYNRNSDQRIVRLYKMALDGSENTLLFEGESFNGIETVGTSIFFSAYTYSDHLIDHTTYYHMNLDETILTELGKIYPGY